MPKNHFLFQNGFQQHVSIVPGVLTVRLEVSLIPLIKSESPLFIGPG